MPKVLATKEGGGGGSERSIMIVIIPLLVWEVVLLTMWTISWHVITVKQLFQCMFDSFVCTCLYLSHLGHQPYTQTMVHLPLGYNILSTLHCHINTFFSPVISTPAPAVRITRRVWVRTSQLLTLHTNLIICFFESLLSCHLFFFCCSNHCMRLLSKETLHSYTTFNDI